MAEVGRPTVMTPEVIEKIEEELKNGATFTQAAFLAEISLRTLYNYFDQNPEFKERCLLLQDLVTYRARKNIRDKINSGDTDLSKYWLDRKDKEFKPKSDLTSDEEAIQPVLVKFIDGNPDNRNPS